MAKSTRRTDWLGDEYWEDEDGNRTYIRKDWLDDTYEQDKEGNRTYIKKDWLGDTYKEDKQGNRENLKENYLGDKYWEDEEGNRTYEREDWLGNKTRISNRSRSNTENSTPPTDSSSSAQSTGNEQQLIYSEDKRRKADNENFVQSVVSGLAAGIGGAFVALLFAIPVAIVASWKARNVEQIMIIVGWSAIIIGGILGYGKGFSGKRKKF